MASTENRCLVVEDQKKNNMSDPPAAVKKSWPELVGKPGEDAKATIVRENPNLSVTAVPDGTPMTMDLRFNRVRVWVDQKGLVLRVPTITPMT